MWAAAVTGLVLVLLVLVTTGVNRNDFKTCDQSSFCRRNRNIEPGSSPYQLSLSSVKTTETSLTAELVNTVTNVPLLLELYTLADSTARVKINELTPIRQRYEVKDSLLPDLKSVRLEVAAQSPESVTVNFGANHIVIHAKPFRMDFYSNGKLVISVNARGLMNFEHYRMKSEQPVKKNDNDVAADQEADENSPQDTSQEQIEPGLWEETFKSHQDSKPYGPSSVGMDVTFVNSNHVYGIPEHADNFALKQTTSTDPYRLYNLDVFEYELYNPMALYGSVPFMVSHSSEAGTVGFLWNNAAETWVDVRNNRDKDLVSSVAKYFSGDPDAPETETHWFSESGIVDMFVLLGPGPKDVSRQYGVLTGTTPLSQLPSFAYHQCRWNYNDQKDVMEVDAGFDQHDIPYDFIWLDIEHTDGKKYFTWDSVKFPDSVAMINNISAKGRKMVTIIDPHIKREAGYKVHSDALREQLYVKNNEGKDYEGWCWPGSSSYLDFFNPKVQDYWSNQFLLENYQGSTLDLYTWNDMNEPSVFNGPEITMHKDLVHHGGWEHRDVHNLYGMLQVKSTYQGQLLRAGGKLRSFVLTRAFFIGSQRYGAVWTGDNKADWSHLKIAVPMLLSLSIVGITHCGADVGGFFHNPDPELLVRWYQAGAFQPFFRAHAHLDTRRREPWLFDQQTTTLIREAIRRRYSLLPFWYTLFYEGETLAIPPMRPLWMEFPADKHTYTMDDQFMIGDALLVHPVTDAGATTVNVYFPGENTVWYDVDTRQPVYGPQTLRVSLDLAKIPVYQRGGTIVPTKERIRRASSLSVHDPYTLTVALDRRGQFANGTLYLDDFQSFEYRNGHYIYKEITFSKNQLTSRSLTPGATLTTKAWIERIVVIGISLPPVKIRLSVEGGPAQLLQSTFDERSRVLTIRSPGVNVAKDWKMDFSLL